MATKEKKVINAEGEELTETMVLIRTRAPNLESVRKLNCWACNIVDVSVVRRMPNLEVCSLTINKITSLQDFAHCYNLQELYVRTNNIQQLSDIHYLTNLKKLRSLWLSENPCATGNNYRMTVLRTLPCLQKLDNIVVTENEIAKARDEGDELPLPNDFSFSSILCEVSLNYDKQKDETGRTSVLGCSGKTSVSGSSEKVARSRQKRQQKKREDYIREIREAQENVKSSDDSGSGSTRSSDDSGSQNAKTGSDNGGDSVDWCNSKRCRVVNDTGCMGGDGQIQKDDGDDHFGGIDNNTTNDDNGSQNNIIQVSWADKVEFPCNVDNNKQEIENEEIEEQIQLFELEDVNKLEKYDEKSNDLHNAEDGGKAEELFLINKIGESNLDARRHLGMSEKFNNGDLSHELDNALDLIPQRNFNQISVENTNSNFSEKEGNRNNSNTAFGLGQDTLQCESQFNSSPSGNVNSTNEVALPLLSQTIVSASLVAPLPNQDESPLPNKNVSPLQNQAVASSDKLRQEDILVTTNPMENQSSTASCHESNKSLDLSAELNTLTTLFKDLPKGQLLKQFLTPMLDNIRLEDSMDTLNSAEDQPNLIRAAGLDKSVEQSPELSFLATFFRDLLSQRPITGEKIESETCFVDKSREPFKGRENKLSTSCVKKSQACLPEERHIEHPSSPIFMPSLGTTFPEDLTLSASIVHVGNSQETKTSTSSVANSNILQAVLCLVEELDKDGLDIVNKAIEGKLESMSNHQHDL